ncbi:MAG: rhodanese-like domain-containing protein [Campylobacterales bacterium]|nr:rhodanese-like domain-containing protein [Campylobacterales bacterium]
MMKKIFIFLLIASVMFGGKIHKIYKADIDNQELEKLINQKVKIIDIRTPPEWSFLGIIPNSKRVMFFDERGGYNIRGFITQLAKEGVNPEEPLVIICRSGNRSVHVSNILTQIGFKEVYNVRQGIKGWIKAGKKVTKSF